VSSNCRQRYHIATGGGGQVSPAPGKGAKPAYAKGGQVGYAKGGVSHKSCPPGFKPMKGK